MKVINLTANGKFACAIVLSVGVGKTQIHDTLAKEIHVSPMSIVCAPIVVCSSVSTLYSMLSSSALRFVV